MINLYIYSILQLICMLIVLLKISLPFEISYQKIYFTNFQEHSNLHHSNQFFLLFTQFFFIKKYFYHNYYNTKYLAFNTHDKC